MYPGIQKSDLIPALKESLQQIHEYPLNYAMAFSFKENKTISVHFYISLVFTGNLVSPIWQLFRLKTVSAIQFERSHFIKSLGLSVLGVFPLLKYSMEVVIFESRHRFSESVSNTCHLNSCLFNRFHLAKNRMHFPSQYGNPLFDTKDEICSCLSDMFRNSILLVQGVVD